MYALARRLVVMLALVAHACVAEGDGDTGMQDMAQDMNSLLVDRPYELKVPTSYDARKPAPLLILLHGYGLHGAEQERRFSLSKTAGDRGMLYAIPDGTKDESSLRFWNATDGCCNLYGSQVDDVAYLRALIQDVRSRYNVDPQRIFLMGHSNGGFMAHRMACDAADLIAGVVSLAGATWNDAARCKPSAQVAVLQVHGDMDVIIKYEGGRFAQSQEVYPGARATVAQWAKSAGCTGMLESAGMPLDLDGDVAGAETKLERYAACPGSAIELWTMQGSGHFPELPPAWAERTIEFLMAHPKR